jgi:tryptophanyl-tRNA synthetase
MDNAKDIISVGFDQKKTFIYSDLKYFGNHFLMNAWEFAKLISFKYVRQSKARLLSSCVTNCDPQQ